MKITTRMKRHASGERGGKASKCRVRNTNKILSFLDFNKAEIPFRKKKSKTKKVKPIYEVGDIIRVQAIQLYSPRIDKDSVPWYVRREEDLNSAFRERVRMWGLNYLVDLTIERVVTEGKVTTYYGKYLDMDVAVEDRFYKITKL